MVAFISAISRRQRVFPSSCHQWVAMAARVLFLCVEIQDGYKILMKDAMKPIETQEFSVTIMVGLNNPRLTNTHQHSKYHLLPNLMKVYRPHLY